VVGEVGGTTSRIESNHLTTVALERVLLELEYYAQSTTWYVLRSYVLVVVR